MHQFLNEVFREVDIFQNNIPLFLQRFVSPLSTIGPNYYKYYMLDTLMMDGQRCVDLSFVPFNSETFGFTGHLYVTLDSTYFVQKAILNVPQKINLNFVSRLTIEQEFRRTADGTRLPVKDDIQVNFKLTENSKRPVCPPPEHLLPAFLRGTAGRGSPGVRTSAPVRHA